MERLEAALSKAREQRKNFAVDPSRPRRADPPPVETADWSLLQSVQIGVEQARRNRLPALTGGKDAVPYDMLRSRTVRIMKEKGWTRLAVTSPDAGCGKTTVAANLALGLSRQRDLRVMLFDLDLRKPNLHNVLGVPARRSFWEVLERKVPFESMAFRIGDNFAVAANVTPCRHPAELLQSSQARDVLDEIEQAWRPDVMIFDMSPMLATDDNVGFLGNVDCAILVAAAEHTKMASIDTCEKELAQLTNVLGVVLNKCRYTDEPGGYGYDGQ